MTEKSTDLALAVDTEGRVVYANHAAARMLGPAPAQLHELRLDDLIVLLPEHRCRIEECVRDGQPCSFETIVRAADDETLPVELRIWPLRSGSGVHGIAVTARDVTERQRIEDALRRSERFLHDVFDGMQDGISVLDCDLSIMRVNSWIERVYAAEMPLVGRKCYEVYQQRHSVCPWCPSITVMKTGRMHSAEVPYRREGGVSGWMDLVCSPLRDPEGNILGVIEYVRDITDRKLAEDALRESEEKYRVLVEQSLQGIVVAQGDRPRLVFANHALAEMLGYTVEELLSLSPEQVQALIHPDDRAMFFQRYQDRRAGKPVRGRYEVRAVPKNGAMMWVEMRASRIEFHGEPAVQAAFVDVTDRKRPEAR